MKISTQININSTKEKVWEVITDIENSASFISGITNIEIINPSRENLVGLKWKETRKMFGKEAHEVMWITDSQKNQFYQTRAENHGAIYVSRLEITEEKAGVLLEMSFEGYGTTLMAKVMSKVFGGMMKKSMCKALEQDLEDIKKACEVS
ncbi:SRPBCC family protein [Virgibacillus sp. W0430]|uniref:SRPBCC family protein n=1 Tax=Virgibacillus sp. W0430 TaxID=3391580 RepID=UPI003F456FD4